MKHTPRGIRNHNPGNIRWGSPWQGLVPKSRRTDKAFCQFQSAAYGIRALACTLITYQDKHKLNTIRQIITRWAPPTCARICTAAYSLRWPCCWCWQAHTPPVAALRAAPKN